jgi:alpha-mannosidase
MSLIPSHSGPVSASTRLLLVASWALAGCAFAEDVHTKITLAKAGDASTPAVSPVKEIIVVIKTHFDIGYTHRVKDVIPFYRTAMIDSALKGMDASMSLPPERQFSWTGPGWVMSKVLEDWPGQTPERRKRLDDAVKSGKFRFHALPFSLESDACEPEEMARGFSFASNISRKYGLPLPIAGKMSDVPSHGGALETVLAHGGVKFMHSGGNWPSGFVKTPGIFWWEGPDGSRTLTFQNGTYGTATGFNWPDNWRSDGYLGTHFVPPANWPYKIWPAILVTMDNSGPPKPETVQAYFNEAQKKCPGAKIRMGTMDDFARAFLAENPDLPVVKGEMPDTWVHGVMSDPGGAKLSREVHPLIASAEALHTQLGLWGATLPTVANEVAEAYENILLYGEHTWGMAPDVRKYGDAFAKADPKLIATLEGSWEDKTNYIRNAEKIACKIAKDNLDALAKSVMADLPSLIVYNPLPWARSGLVEFEGKKLAVKDVPPCGYKTVSATPAATLPAAGDTIENKFYKITFDPAGGRIASLVDKRSGREWVDATAERGLGAYMNERFTFEQTLAYTTKYQMGRYMPHPGLHKPGMVSEKAVPYRAVAAANGTLAVTADDDSQTAVLSCPADPANHKPATELRVTLPKDSPYIELEMTIKDKAKDNWPEADWFCLPFKVESPKFRVYRQLGAIDPATDILDGANRDLLSVSHGVTISGPDGAGIAISPLDHPLVSLDRPGIWKFSKDAAEFTPKKPVVYLNLYNNMWNTNFRYWYTGTWSSRVRLSTFDAKTAPEDVIATSALEARNPMLVTRLLGTSTGKSLPLEQSGLSVSRKGTNVTAFGANPDGPGTLLRVWEMAGLSGDLTVTLPSGEKSTKALPVNLRGEKAGAPLDIKNGKLVFPLKAYAPASFVLE